MAENHQTFRQAVMEFTRVAYTELIMYPPFGRPARNRFSILKRKRKHRDTGQVIDPGEYFYTADEIAMMPLAEALIRLGNSYGISVDEAADAFASVFRETACLGDEIIEG